mgnify:CR=1 FL=1
MPSLLAMPYLDGMDPNDPMSTWNDSCMNPRPASVLRSIVMQSRISLSSVEVKALIIMLIDIDKDKVKNR